MTFLKNTFKHIVFSALSILGGVALGATLVGAVTTISTNVVTEGTLSVTGLSTLTAGYVSQASSTVVGAFTATGAAALGSTLDVTGATTLASTTATSFKAGQTGTQHTGLVSGYCTIANVSVTASSTGMVSCSSATGVASGDRVFVQATSSLPDNFVIQAASTTATDVIQVDILNIPTTTADGGADDTGVHSFNFWAVR